MIRRIHMEIALLATCALLLCSGCTQQPVQAAAEGGLPGVKIPVGPIPGPQMEFKMPTNPYEENSVAMEEGRRLFVWYNCYGCHGGHAGGGMGPSLRGPVWIYGGDPAHVFASIAEGRGKGMPSWGTKIPQDQIWKLVAYIETLGTPQEPDAPHVAPDPQVKEKK